MYKLCFLITLLFSTEYFAQSITFIQDTIARNELFNNRQFAAYDKNGYLHISYTGQNGTNGATREIYYVRETASGFQLQNITNNSVDDNYSTLSIDAQNKVHIGFTGRDASSLFQIKYTNNISGSFFEPIYITTGGLNKATPYSVIGPDSVMHFVYFTFTTGDDNIYYRNYDLRTSVLSNEVLLTRGETSGDFDAAIAVDKQGKIHIAVKAGGVNTGTLKYYNNISGVLTEIPTGITPTISYPKITVDKNNVVHILYRDDTETRLNVINNAGGNFGPPVAVTPVGQRPASYQNITTDDSSRLYITYQSSVSSSGKGFYFVHGRNGVFSDTIKLYDLTPEYVTRNSSVVAARGNGEVTILYAPGAVRNSLVVCDIFRLRAHLFGVVPVELSSFWVNTQGKSATLNWVTKTETQNRGFAIERKSGTADWIQAGFVKGAGNSLNEKRYSFTDYNLPAEKITYRLRQENYDGTFSYSHEVQADLTAVSTLELNQNYPNPFNPFTTIRFSLPTSSEIQLAVYDVLGNEVAVLASGYKDAGVYTVQFDASPLSSGIYYYTLRAGEEIKVKRLAVIK